MGAAEIAAGWYADPLVPGHIRYWDGSGWTEHTASPLPTWAPHPMTTFPTSAAPLPPVTPRAPRRPLPLPARFVLGTALIGFPVAIGIGVLAAHASALPPLETPAAAETIAAVPTPAPAERPVPTEDATLPENSADAAALIQSQDAAAQKDVAAISQAVEDFYSTPERSLKTPPTVILGGATYVVILTPEFGGVPDWSWPDIAASDGVRNAGVYGHSSDTWCAWVYIGNDPGRIWKATPDGISEGDCVIG